jgi:CRISPR system Cascade subunit CasD
MASQREFLLARLWGPMASWGQIAVGEQRQTWTRPSRSAILGLIAAALGYERGNQDAHAALERGLGLAIRVDADGRPMRDYHTAQSPQSESKRRWRSRYDEIRSSRKLNTILSDRSYLIEAAATIALWHRPHSNAPDLAEIAEKLTRPTFVLYLGRKASPLGLPPHPFVVSEPGLAQAFATFDSASAERTACLDAHARWLLPAEAGAGASSIWLSRDDIEASSPLYADLGPLAPRTYTRRRDGIRDRRTWTFDDREEVLVSFMEGDNS